VPVFGITPDPFAELMPSRSAGGAAAAGARKALINMANLSLSIAAGGFHVPVGI
jgi:hypothetical protein